MRGAAVAQLDVHADSLAQRDDSRPQRVGFAVNFLGEAMSQQRVENVVRRALGHVQPRANLGQRQAWLSAAEELHDADSFC